MPAHEEETATALHNPYWAAFCQVRHESRTVQWAARDLLTLRYAWGIPDDEVIRRIAEFSDNKVVEMGAGSGYWAWLLSQLNVEVDAWDANPEASITEGTPWEHKWFNVQEGTPEVLSDNRYIDWTLLLVWPPLSDPMATNALKAFSGSQVVYVGENGEGCTADGEFHDLLYEEFDYVDGYQNPAWQLLNDCTYFFKRK